jgi:glutathione synthase/RimK-type ligase-like ATP-grasp enzyme
MKRLIILTDENQQFLISKANYRYFTSMDITKIKKYFIQREYEVIILKFSELDLSKEYKDVYFMYQTSEAPGGFYKRYIEDLIYFLESQGAVTLPGYRLLKAHHNKVFMELMRAGFSDPALKTIKSACFGSWTDARNYNSGFPVVIKQASNSGGAGVFLARNKKEYGRKVKKAGGVIIANNLPALFTDYVKRSVKKIILKIYPEKSKETITYDVQPASTSIIVQNFIPGLSGDYKVLFFGGKYFMMYRQNRENDFRASGSGQFFPVPDQDHEGILNFARRLTEEIDYPVIGMDIGFDGSSYHMIEFQVIHIGTSALHRSKYWHEFHDGKWIRYDGLSDLEEELSRAMCNFIEHAQGK